MKTARARLRKRPSDGTAASASGAIPTPAATARPARSRARGSGRDAPAPEASKYHNRFLFDLSGKAIGDCLGRLRVQPEMYLTASPLGRRTMNVKALFTVACTLNATAIWTAKLLHRGRLSMISQKLFFRKRWRMDPKDWGENAKSCFARALSGYSIGPDAVCLDRHLNRMELRPKDAPDQWKDWFRLYESMYGPGETVLCVRWHERLLDWIAGRSGRPEAWK